MGTDLLSNNTSKAKSAQVIFAVVINGAIGILQNHNSFVRMPFVRSVAD